MNEGYILTMIDHDAKYYCNQMGYFCETVPVVTGSAKSDFSVGVEHNGVLTIRKKTWSYLDQQEALYSTYRAIAAKLLNK